MRCFISSVTDQMKEHRQAVVEAIRYLREYRGFDLVPFLNEDYPMPSAQPQNSYLDELDKSDAMILILDKNYGRVVPEYGISATHREYKRAVETGKIIIPFYNLNKEEYEQNELEFLSEVLKEAQAYDYDGTHKDLEIQVQRVIEKLYRGSIEKNLSQAERDGLNFVFQNKISSVAIFSSRVNTEIEIGEELKNQMKNSSSWLNMINLSSKHQVSRNYFESRYDEDSGPFSFCSLGRLYNNGEILFITIAPFITFDFNSTSGYISNYSRNIEPIYLQQKVSEFAIFVSSYARNHNHVGPIKLNLTLNSNEPMQLNNHFGVTNMVLQTLIGNQVNHQSDNKTETFSWQINSNAQDNEVLLKTRDQLLRELYHAFHYSEPELCEPFNKIIKNN